MSGERKAHRHFITHSFLITTILAIILHALNFNVKAIFSGMVITIALITFFWYWSAKSKTTKSAIIASQVLILLHVLGSSFNLYPRAFAGVTYDTYMHLLAAFVAAMLAAEYFHDEKKDNELQALIIGGLIALALGIGVEVVEILDGILFNAYGPAFIDALKSFSPYVQDTLKDLVNDSLGIILFILARTSRKELLKI